MVHIDEHLDPGAVNRARSRLHTEKGIVETAPCQDKSHLMMVRYDPGATSAGQIVATLRGLGLHAQAVGL
jgi:hypothetical protein